CHPRGLPASISGILMALRTTTRESILGTTVGPIGRFRKRLVTCCTGPHENPFTYKKCPTAACGFHGSRAGEPGVVFGFLTPRTPDNVSGLSQDFPGKLISQPSYLPDRLRRQPWRSPVEIRTLPDTYTHAVPTRPDHHRPLSHTRKRASPPLVSRKALPTDRTWPDTAATHSPRQQEATTQHVYDA